jgi:hypothetical protein
LLKRTILILLLVFSSLACLAQPQWVELNLRHYDIKKIRFGFTLGANVLDFSTVNVLQPVKLPGQTDAVKVRADVVTARPGFSINAILDYRLSSAFNARILPGICFGSRDMVFYDEEAPGNVELYKMPIQSNYIELPIQIKYNAKRHSNFRPYIIAGANFRSNLTFKEDEQKGTYYEFPQFEPFVEFGIGLDTYFYYFKLSVELKVSKGLENVMAKRKVTPGYEPFLDVIDKMNSQSIQLSFHFE